ncbi:hypothetical protein Patl1_26633 [Pistacia atlantica]|uniref:Uncharacterized protein n=1 Tax=Pistacia atlantica TaxID=434234 RepID=A0ACC1B477_9ROSI|nr:hypothetical protein Patl1_26633 [Pistacia atlantica]
MEDSRQEELEEEVNATTGSFICEICVESVSENKKFKTKNHCVHHFYVNCIAKYIETKITENTVKIKCPGLDCQQVLDPISCREIIPQSIFSKWWFKRSYCANRNCRELVVNECGENLKKSKCPHCEELFCFDCKVAWHAGYGCEEARRHGIPNDTLFLQLVKRKAWIKCPGCGHFVERIKGCNSIKCRCRAEFCYECGKAIRECECRGYRRDFYWLLISSVVLIILLTLFLHFEPL